MTTALQPPYIAIFKHIRIACLFAALLLYGLFSSPTPDHIGWAEIVIGLLLVTAVSVQGIYGAFQNYTLQRHDRHWFAAGRLLLVYGLTVPLLVALLMGNAFGSIIRDIVPYLFLLLPVLAGPLLSTRPTDKKYLIVAILFIGIAFSLRVLLPVLSIPEGFGGLSQSIRSHPDDPAYLANAPTVLFSAVFLLAYGGFLVYKSSSFVSFAKSLAMILLAMIPVMAMAAIMQRASIGYIGFALLLLLMLAISKNPLRAIVPLVLAFLIALLVWNDLQDLSQRLWHKTELVGLNMRAQEALLVVKDVSQSLWFILFGKGWGAMIASPAVGGASVNFTHSLITATWLKTGLIGVAILGLYLFHLAHMLFRMLWQHPVLAAALAGPFVIDIFLYASYKSLDFGLILLLIVLWSKRAIEKRPEVV